MDDQLAKDYRKMWEKYNQMEAMLKQKNVAPAAAAAAPEDDD